MKVNLVILLVAMNIIFIGSVSAEIFQNRLSKNPFIKPGFVNVKQGSAGDISNAGPDLSDDSLRATLVSGEKSIANISGRMIFVGEKIQGYELISVEVGSATLTKNENEITLHVNEIHKKLK